jgi:hypothetical protein
MTRSLYNGQYVLEHNPNARGRQPRYLINGVQKPKGVTTILGNTLSKDLMQWAVDCALDYLKDKIPMVTKDDLQEAGQEYIRRRDSGAGTGSEAHAMVEQFLKETKPQGEFSQEAINAYNAFVKWFSVSPATVINVEECIYSASKQYAGTYDCMLDIDGKVYLCDLKTTNASRKAPNGVYAEYFLQLGAYAHAHHEQMQYELDNGGTELRPIDGLLVISAKKNGKLDLVSNEDLGLTLAECEENFIKVVDIHNFLSDNTKKLGGR